MRIKTFYTYILLVFTGIALTGCGNGARSPEQAIQQYTKAIYQNDRKALEKYWWISEDKKVRQVVIENKMIMNKYNETLQKVANKTLQEMIASNQLQDLTPKKPLSKKQIKQALRNVHQKEGEQRFAVFLPDTPMLYVGKHQNKWYVEHMYNAVNRTWTENEVKFTQAVNDMYKEEIKHIKDSRELLQTQIGLKFYLMGVAAKQNKLMGDYDVPLIVGF